MSCADIHPELTSCCEFALFHILSSAFALDCRLWFGAFAWLLRGLSVLNRVVAMFPPLSPCNTGQEGPSVSLMFSHTCRGGAPLVGSVLISLAGGTVRAWIRTMAIDRPWLRRSQKWPLFNERGLIITRRVVLRAMPRMRAGSYFTLSQKIRQSGVRTFGRWLSGNQNANTSLNARRVGCPSYGILRTLPDCATGFQSSGQSTVALPSVFSNRNMVFSNRPPVKRSHITPGGFPTRLIPLRRSSP